MNIKKLFTIVFLSSFSIYLFYLGWFYHVLNFFLSLLFYLFITYVIYKLWKIIRHSKYSIIKHLLKAIFLLDFNTKHHHLKEARHQFHEISLPFTKYIWLFFYRVSTSLFLLFTLLGWFAYYQNVLSPAEMPNITISNWKKTVVFQAMSHIWTQDFYDNVRKNIINAKKEWFVYFFEWVKPWKAESNKAFDKAIWFQFDKDLYKNFSKVYGVTNQDNNYFLWLWDKNCDLDYCDFNVDLSMDEIVDSYKEKQIQDPNWVNNSDRLPLDANKEILNSLSKLNDRELKLLVYVNKSILNLIIKSDGIKDFVTKNFANQQLFDVILNKRNEVLTDEIIKSKHDKIFITYWLLHFNWVFEILKKNDPNWKIIKKEVLYPIK
jgi:hypothetical protein